MIPNITGTVEYKTYNQTVNQIKEFDQYSILGKDDSGKYDIYLIELGERGKPSLLITCSLHGTEWQGTQYTLKFLKMLNDDTFPDKPFRDNLINNYHILCIPMVNPWGVDNTTANEPISRNIGRHNSNGIDVNRDFDMFVTSEARLCKYVMDNFPIFAYLDCHMIISNEPTVIVGHGQLATTNIRDEWVQELGVYTGFDITAWSSSVGVGLSRRYMRDKGNPYTDYTLSYITEITRPEEVDGVIKAPITNEDIFKIGIGNLYLFFETSLGYIKGNEFMGVGDFIYKIEYDHKIVNLERDINGLLLSVNEEYDETCNNMVINTKINRNLQGKITSIEREKI